MKKSYLLTLCVFCLTSASTPAFAAKKCKDFKTQQAAQVFYETQKKQEKQAGKALIGTETAGLATAIREAATEIVRPSVQDNLAD